MEEVFISVVAILSIMVMIFGHTICRQSKTIDELSERNKSLEWNQVLRGRAVQQLKELGKSMQSLIDNTANQGDPNDDKLDNTATKVE